MSLLTAYHLHIIHVQHPHRALPYAMGTSGGPASLPYYFAAFLTIDSTKTTLAKREPRCLFRGATPLLILQFPQFPGHAHPNLAAFGRIPADHAVPVLVASPPPAGVRVGEARVHARPVAQARAAGEPGAVVARDGDARRPAADARRWEPVRESGNATSSRRHACDASRGRVEGSAPGAHGDGGRRRSNGRRSPGTRAWRSRRGTGRAARRR